MHNATTPISWIHGAKSLLIVCYIAFIFYAGLSRISNSPHQALLRLWGGLNMFEGASGNRVDLTIIGTLENGTRARIDLAPFFPYPKTLIERGQAFSILDHAAYYDDFRFGQRLCEFILTRYRDMSPGTSPLAKLEFVRETRPLRAPDALSRRSVFTQCRAQ